MARRLSIAAVVGVGTLLATAGASAKDLKPGDVSVCNAKKCVAIKNGGAARALSSFYYDGPQPSVAARPRLGAPAFRLRFRNGYVTGIVATKRLDRFLSYGVVLERFKRGKWYRLPSAAAAELRHLTSALRPMRLTQAALAKSR
jgi:hypothetical protein